MATACTSGAGCAAAVIDGGLGAAIAGAGVTFASVIKGVSIFALTAASGAGLAIGLASGLGVGLRTTAVTGLGTAGMGFGGADGATAGSAINCVIKTVGTSGEMRGVARNVTMQMTSITCSPMIPASTATRERPFVSNEAMSAPRSDEPLKTAEKGIAATFTFLLHDVKGAKTACGTLGPPVSRSGAGPGWQSPNLESVRGVDFAADAPSV